MTKAKKVPIRMCCGCGENYPKREMVRVVKSPQGEVSLDTTGKKSGRGAYICHKVECLDKAQKSRRLERVLASKIPQEVYEVLRDGLTESN